MPSSIHRMTLALRSFGKGVAIACFALAAASAAKADDDGGIRLVTQNMYVGSSFAPLLAAHTSLELAAAVTTIYNNITATRPTERAAAMAREIAQHHADLVTLQEAAILRTGPSRQPATIVQEDLLQSLIDALAGLGHRYVAVAIVPGVDAQGPSTLHCGSSTPTCDVRVTIQDAILVRADLLADELEVSNLQIEQFGIKLTLPSSLGPFTDTRGWAAIDVKARGRSFRLVTTHLDSSSSARIRVAQAGELLRTAANTSLPVVMAGDFNIPADTPLDPSFPAYQAMINAGFSDAWRVKRAPDRG